MYALAAGLFLALSTASPTLPATGRGFVEKTDGEYSFVTWALNGMGTTGMGGGAGAPIGCRATCAVDFGQEVTRWPFADHDGFIVVPLLKFSGPVVSATAVQQCPDCAPQGRTWITQWPTVPITVAGTVLFIDRQNNGQRTIFEIAGSGTATAYSYVEAMQGPWNYATLRWDFTYSVVPEPSTWLLLATGLVMVLAAGALRAKRSRRENNGHDVAGG